MNRILIAIISNFIVAGALYGGIEGTYSMKGWDPYQQSNYTGTATITKDEKNSNVYQAVWSYGERKFVGTGLIKDNIASFICIAPALGASLNQNEPQITMTVYKIVGDDLKGSWIRVHGSLIGEEELQKKF